ncbi:DUF1648 domain-containing protein [Saccharopolyspora rhizosphaerae]|uniref:DUF1648 domain-containing protein n=1 Tax=Saccharopolyspora rhizosphaerae TaxID=2492662 RepID=UPI0013156C84|nr:DUF1648 domain-containing protein [Saccharopolyspora rhizosphaerae]
MNPRKTFLAVSLTWTVVATVALVAPLVLLRDRLPDPVATHFTGAGVPDGSMSHAVFPLVVLPGWLLAAAFGVVGGAVGKRRAQRAGSAALLAATAVFFGSLVLSTVGANLDHVDWRDARLPLWHVLVVLLASAAAGGVGWLLGNRGPDEGDAGPAPQSGELDLAPGQRAVWVSSVTSPVLVVTGSAVLVVGVVVAALGSWQAALPELFAGVVVTALSTARVRVDERGVHTTFGPQRFPTRRIRLEQISSAGVARHRALAVGGWGYRVLPATTAIMLRGGECLVLRLTSGRDFVISVDKPERGAELVNALLAERSAM